MIVTLIPPEYINKEWSKAAPLILKGIQYDGGRWNKDNGCKFVEFTGRKGWQRKLDKLGWKPEYVSFRMEV
jgi:hypothetical protein